MIHAERGFHLLEVLIALVIIGILASIGLPTYSQYVIHAKRLEAINMLGRLSIAMERYHIEHSTYQGATLAILHIPERLAKNNYQFAIQLTTNNAYALAAIPIGKQAEKDSACGTLVLNSLGEKNISGSAQVDECWY